MKRRDVIHDSSVGELQKWEEGKALIQRTQKATNEMKITPKDKRFDEQDKNDDIRGPQSDM